MTLQSLPISSLSPDPANVRLHSPRNLAAIAASLRRFGQQKPIVIDQNNVVRAGNGTLAAAISLGWTEIQTIRTHLEGPEATAFAIADNRAAELADWDDHALADQLASLKDAAVTLSDIGFTDKELKKLLAQDDDKEPNAAQQWLVMITCKDESDQLALIEQLESNGRACRALIG